MEGFFNFVSLNTKIRYTLGKADRLKSRKAIEFLFKSGRSFSIFPFRIIYQFQEKTPIGTNSPESPANSGIQAGFTASSRNFKKAVDRNRIKRLMKEAYRLQKNKLRLISELDHYKLTLFFIYSGKDLPEYKLIYEKMGDVLNRLTRITHDKK